MTHFEPVDGREHKLGAAGHGNTDWCANCGAPFMEHNNGECPKNEGIDNESDE